MIRAVIKNGAIQPLEPLPPDWEDGRQVVVDQMEPAAQEGGEFDRWSNEMNELTAALNDAEEWRAIEVTLAEADRAAKAAVRSSSL